MNHCKLRNQSKIKNNLNLSKPCSPVVHPTMHSLLCTSNRIKQALCVLVCACLFWACITCNLNKNFKSAFLPGLQQGTRHITVDSDEREIVLFIWGFILSFCINLGVIHWNIILWEHHISTLSVHGWMQEWVLKLLVVV